MSNARKKIDGDPPFPHFAYPWAMTTDGWRFSRAVDALGIRRTLARRQRKNVWVTPLPLTAQFAKCEWTHETWWSLTECGFTIG